MFQQPKRSVSMYLKLLSVLTIGLTFTTSATAEIYRWVDENGVVNYSQKKPDGVDAENVERSGLRRASANRETATAEESEATETDSNLTEEQQQMLDNLKAAEAKRQEEIAEIRASNCEKSRTLLDRLTQSERIRTRADDGTETIMGEDERQRRIDEAQRGIATNCEAA